HHVRTLVGRARMCGWFVSVVETRTSNGRTETGHPQRSSGVLGGRRPHGDEFLFGGGECGLYRGYLAQAALLLGFLQPVEEVRVDPFQPRHLGGVDPQEWTSDAGFSELDDRRCEARSRAGDAAAITAVSTALRTTRSFWATRVRTLSAGLDDG